MHIQAPNKIVFIYTKPLVSSIQLIFVFSKAQIKNGQNGILIYLKRHHKVSEEKRRKKIQLKRHNDIEKYTFMTI